MNKYRVTVVDNRKGLKDEVEVMAMDALYAEFQAFLKTGMEIVKTEMIGVIEE